MKLDHFMIRVASVDETIEFYTKNFGVVVDNHDKHDGFAMAYLKMAGSDTMIEVVENDGVGNYDHGNGFDHIAFRSDDLHGDLKKLADNSVFPVKKKKFGEYSICPFEDPDGYKVVVYAKEHLEDSEYEV